MAWWNPVQWWSGVDMEAEIERGRELDRQMDELNRRKVAEGKMTPEQYSGYVEHNDWADEYRADVTDAFWQGLKSGWDRIISPVKSVVETGKQAWTFAMLLQFALVAFAIYLAYLYFKKGGKVPI